MVLVSLEIGSVSLVVKLELIAASAEVTFAPEFVNEMEADGSELLPLSSASFPLMFFPLFGVPIRRSCLPHFLHLPRT